MLWEQSTRSQLEGRTFTTAGFSRSRHIPFEVLSIRHDGLVIRNSRGNNRFIPKTEFDRMDEFRAGRMEEAEIRRNRHNSYIHGIEKGAIQ